MGSVFTFKPPVGFDPVAFLDDYAYTLDEAGSACDDHYPGVFVLALVETLTVRQAVEFGAAIEDVCSVTGQSGVLTRGTAQEGFAIGKILIDGRGLTEPPSAGSVLVSDGTSLRVSRGPLFNDSGHSVFDDDGNSIVQG